MFFPTFTLGKPVEDVFLPGDEELYAPVVHRAREGRLFASVPDSMLFDGHVTTLEELRQMITKWFGDDDSDYKGADSDEATQRLY